MHVISVDPNHPTASAARRMVGEQMPRAPICKSPPQVAKTKAKMVMHGALAAAAARPAADVDGADYAATRGSVALPAISINSSSASASDDMEITGGNHAALGCKSTGLTDLTDSPPASPTFSEEDIFAGVGGGSLTMICPLMRKQISILFWIVSSMIWSGHLLVSQIARL